LFLQPVLWVTAHVQPTRGDPDLTLSGVTGGIAVGVFNSAQPDGLPDTVFGQIALPFFVGFSPTITVIPFATPINTFLGISGFFA